MTITTSPISEIEALGNLPHLHARVANGIVWLRAHNTSAEQFELGRKRLNAVVDDYLRELERLRARVSVNELEAQNAAIEARLNVGFDQPGAKADDRFAQLLTVHEILVDALLSSTYLERIAERIELSRALQPGQDGDATTASRLPARAGVGE